MLEGIQSDLKQPTPEEVKRFLENMKGQQFHLQAGPGWARIVAENITIREIRPAQVVVPATLLMKWGAMLITQPFVVINEIVSAQGLPDRSENGKVGM